MFENHSVDPGFAAPCNRWENGTYTTPKGDCSWKDSVMTHPRRRFPVTDVELGATAAITNFRDDWLDVHIFKFNKDGKIELIQAVDGPGRRARAGRTTSSDFYREATSRVLTSDRSIIRIRNPDMIRIWRKLTLSVNARVVSRAKAIREAARNLHFKDGGNLARCGCRIALLALPARLPILRSFAEFSGMRTSTSIGSISRRNISEENPLRHQCHPGRTA